MTRPERLTTSLNFVGNKIIVSVCRSASVAPLKPTYHLRSPTGDKPWYLHRGKFAVVLHHAFHLGLTNEGREITIIISHINDTSRKRSWWWRSSRRSILPPAG